MTGVRRRVGFLSGVLGLLAAIYVVGLVMNRPRVEPLLVPGLEVSAVTKIDAGSISLRASESGSWQLSIDSSWYPAAAAKIDRMLAEVSNLRASRVVTHSRSDWAGFSVDDGSATKLLLSSSSGTIATLYVGTTGSDGGTYVRTSSGPAVYEVFGRLSDFVAADATYWSSLKILPPQVSVDSLQTISIAAHGFSVGGTTVNGSYLLSSSAVGGKSAWVAGDGHPLDQKKLLSLEGELIQLQGDRFAAQVSARDAGMADPTAVIEVTDQQGGSWKVIVGKRYGAQFYVKRADEPYIYLVNQWSLHRALPKLSELESSP